MFNYVFFLKSYHFWDNVENIVQPDRPETIKRRMRIAFWVPKFINTQSEYVILTALLLQQQLQESASVLRLYVQCLSFYGIHLFPVMTGKIWQEVDSVL